MPHVMGEGIESVNTVGILENGQRYINYKETKCH